MVVLKINISDVSSNVVSESVFITFNFNGYDVRTCVFFLCLKEDFVFHFY
jgi:hypothetical protein